MKSVLFLVVLFVLVGCSVGVVPSAMIVHKAPPQLINLTNVDVTSVLNLDASNAPLLLYSPMGLFELGHYHSDFIERNLTSEGIPKSLINFSQVVPPVPVSVGDGEGAVPLGVPKPTSVNNIPIL